MCEEIFAVEIVVVDDIIVVGVYGRGTEITAPESELYVLGADVSFPFILGSEF